MAITGCTDNYYTYEIPWNPSGDTVTAPHPVYTDGKNQNVGAQQCGAVTLGGFNGLNN
jgi:hypothetical protein